MKASLSGKQIRWLVIGVGDIAVKRVLPAILAEPRSILEGVVTRSPEKAASFQTRAWTSLDEALGHPGIDAVYVATPVAFHAPQTITCLRAQKHVLCEKPMAMNYREACAMQEASKDVGKILGIAYYRRLYPKLRRAAELLRGAIGQPVLAEINCHGWFQAQDGRRGWLLDPELSGGGPLYDIASHRIDVMNFLFGRPVRVSGHLSRSVHKKSAVEDSATVLIDYENGVRGVVDVRWHSHIDRDEFRIIGTDGEIRLSPLNGPGLRYPGGEDSMPLHANVHYPLIEDFVSAVTDNRPPACPAGDALWTDWVTEQVMAQNH